MRASLSFSCALLLSLMLGESSWAQFGRPPVTVPRPAPFVPHPVYHGSGGSGSSDGSGWVWAVVLLAGLGAVALIAFGQARRKRADGGLIRITAVPPGEAPEAVRRAWVGLELPFVGNRVGPQTQAVVGVVSHRPAGTREGFAVDGARAIALLAARDPQAAAWWRGRAPHVLASGYQFVFPPESCQQIG